MKKSAPLRKPGEIDAARGISEVSRHTFILEVWRERTAREAGFPLWRGSIHQVGDAGTKTRRNFSTIAALIQFLEGRLNKLSNKHGEKEDA